jgi:hypothetical protein
MTSERPRRRPVGAVLGACVVCIVLAPAANAQSPTPTPAPGAVAGTAGATRIAYKPPLRGAPSLRVDGGSRGSGVSLITLTVLAPDHPGLTVREQPSLYWYQSEAADVPLEVTVIRDGVPTPLLAVSVPHATLSGIHELRLADHGTKLAAGVEYEWVVALVVDAESRSSDVVASGFIRRVEPSADLSRRLAGASRGELPYIYAEEGLWYDAFEALSNLIDARPDDLSLLAERSALLRQVGLTSAAAFVSAPRAAAAAGRTRRASP